MTPGNLLDPEMLDSYRDLQSPDDPEFFKNYLMAFLSALPEHLAGLAMAALKKDSQALARSAHAIKSTCLNVGAASIVERCAKLEALGKANAFTDADRLISEVSVLCEELKAEVHALPEFSSGK